MCFKVISAFCRSQAFWAVVLWVHFPEMTVLQRKTKLPSSSTKLKKKRKKKTLGLRSF